jgi:hypothetical protein
VFAINVYVFVLHKGSIRVGDHELSFRDKAMASVVGEYARQVERAFLTPSDV